MLNELINIWNNWYNECKSVNISFTLLANDDFDRPSRRCKIILMQNELLQLIENNGKHNNICANSVGLLISKETFYNTVQFRYGFGHE